MVMVKEYYQNKRNPHKYLEVHYDGYRHQSWREIINTNVRTYVGDGNLHRVSKRTLEEVLEDYNPTPSGTLVARCTYCGTKGTYDVFGEEYDNLMKYVDGLDDYHLGSSAGFIQDLIPTVPQWIRSGAIQHMSCSCNKCNPFK